MFVVQIKVLKKPGGTLHDSFLEEGFILEKRIGQPTTMPWQTERQTYIQTYITPFFFCLPSQYPPHSQVWVSRSAWRTARHAAHTTHTRQTPRQTDSHRQTAELDGRVRAYAGVLSVLYVT